MFYFCGSYFRCHAAEEQPVPTVVSARSGPAQGTTATHNRRIACGDGIVCALAKDGIVNCLARGRHHGPPLETSARFRQVSISKRSITGLESSGRAQQLFAEPSGSEAQTLLVRLADDAASSQIDCGIEPQGSAICWGTFFAQERSPRGLLPFTEIVVSGETLCGLSDQRSVACWTAGYSVPNADIQSRFGNDRFSEIVLAGQWAYAGLSDEHTILWWSIYGGRLLGVRRVHSRLPIWILRGGAGLCVLRSNEEIVCFDFPNGAGDGDYELERLPHSVYDGRPAMDFCRAADLCLLDEFDVINCVSKPGVFRSQWIPVNRN